MQEPTSRQKEEWQIQARRLKDMVEHLPVGAVFIEDEMFMINRATEILTGYGRNELTSLDQWFTTLYGDSAAEIRRSYEEDHDSNFPVKTKPYIITRRDGVERAVEFAAYRFDDHEIWLLYDVTERHKAERALHESEERVRAILNTAIDAIITIDQTGIINGVNPETGRMFGYTEDELIGQNVSILMPEPYCNEHDGYIRRYMTTGEARILGMRRETVARRKDGSIFPVGLAVTEIDHLALFTGIISDISARKELEKQLLEIVAEEDRRIGIELHDNVQQQLTGLEMLAKSITARLGTVQDKEPRYAEISDMLHRLSEGLNETTRQVRSLAHGLVPVLVDNAGLHTALMDLVSEIREQYVIHCDFHSNGPVTVSDNFIATHLYRIAQEAINNAIVHARSGRIEISLYSEDHRLTLKVSDDGVGLNKKYDTGSGMGLKIMQYRASVIGAQLHIGQNAAGGTEVVCTVTTR